MRPVPKGQSWKAIILFVAVAASYEYLAWHDTRLGDTQAYIASAAARSTDEGLFRHDAVFGTRLWQLHSPLAQGVVRLCLAGSSADDLTLPFRLLSGVLTLIYLCGMYSLLHRQCRSWSVAAFTAILSTAVIYTLGSSYWGVGSLASATPWTAVICLTPLVMLAFLKHMQRPSRLVLVFAVIGIAGNVHLAAAMNLALVLIIVYLAAMRFAPKAWLVGALCGLASVVAAMPYIIHFLVVRAASDSLDVQPGQQAAAAAFRMSDQAIMYPELLAGLWNWAVLVAIVLVLPAVIVLSRIERYRVRDMRVWVAFIIAALVVAFGFHGVSQLMGHMAGAAPPVIDFVQASSLMMLPLYVLFAQALTHIFRLVRTHRGVVLAACAVIMAMWMLPSDNLRPARYAVLDTATMFMPEADKPKSVQRHHEVYHKSLELKSIAHFARQGTDPDSVFLTDQAEFRMHSRRAILAAPQDARYVYDLAPGRLDEWLSVIETQQQLLHPPAPPGGDGRKIVQFVRSRIEADPQLRAVPEWFIILQADEAPPEPWPHLEEYRSDLWGQYYRMFRLTLERTTK